MTDRYNALIVTLRKPVRSDDAEEIINAIKMIKGVTGVNGRVANVEDYIARKSAQDDLGRKIIDMIIKYNSEQPGE